MLINGEKFACEACVRGHRVSSCHHQDRPLVHVNKKGRPVSQCQHCRGLRKARSQHVKCECHDKAHAKEDCPHEKTDGKSEAHTCCCQHGARCTCSLKKEHLDPVPEDIHQLIQPKDHHKQRPNHNSHEAKTTIFTNGHHKPVHKFNDAHNQLGNPYKIPSRSHSLHGHREIAQRSTDSLPLTKFSKPFHESPLHTSMTDAMDIVQRKVKSEHNSPTLGPQMLAANPSMRDFSLGSFDPNAYAYSPFGGTDSPATQTGSLQNSQNASQQDLTLPERFPDTWFMSYAQAHEYEPPPHAKFEDLGSVDWSSLSLDNGNSLYNVNKGNSPYLSQQAPYPTFDLSSQISQVGITSSSGEASEVGEHSPPIRWGNEQVVDPKFNAEAYDDFGGVAGEGTSDRYRLSGASFYGTPQASNMLGTGNRGSLDIDEIISQSEAETKRIQMQNQLTQMQLTQQDVEQRSRMSSVSRGMTPSVSTPGSTATGEHSYTLREAQRYAHLEGFSNDTPPQTKSPMPPSSMAEDPSWSVAPDMTNPELALDDEREDEDWVR